MYRLLHISDLHRSPDNSVNNDALIAALDCDFEAQQRETPQIGPIDAVIVSGDVIQGVPLGEPAYQNKIREQYQIATEFLDKLSGRYLSGKRSNIVIVPGNHDVDWNTATSGMTEFPPDKQETDLLPYLQRSIFRFCFKTRKLFHIENQGKYAARFDEYNRFVLEFYKNSDISFPISSDGYFNLFELNQGRIIVAAFNSCYQNDCYRDSGSIPDGAIGKAYLQIKDAGKDYDLRLAVWHHSLYGPPTSTDYMNVELAREMTSDHFQLGLHGHQHKADVYPERIYLPTEKYMVIVSAGSLCAAPRELPVGEKRQYNIIEIKDGYTSIRVHVREMILERAFGPKKLHSFGGKSYIDLCLSHNFVEENRTTERILRAESLISKGNYEATIHELTSHFRDLPKHGRKLLLAAYEGGRYWDLLTQRFSPPRTISELHSLAHAYEELGKFQEGKHALDEYAEIVGLPEIQKREIESRLDLAIKVQS